MNFCGKRQTGSGLDLNAMQPIMLVIDIEGIPSKYTPALVSTSM